MRGRTTSAATIRARLQRLAYLSKGSGPARSARPREGVPVERARGVEPVGPEPVLKAAVALPADDHEREVDGGGHGQKTPSALIARGSSAS
jgi:hypothetical protein